MKKWLRLLSVTLAVLALLVFATSCDLSERGEQAKALCAQMTDAILADDAEAAYAIVSDACTEDEFATVYESILPLFQGIASYELRQAGFQSKMENGVVSYTATCYVVCEGEERLAVEVATVDGYEGLTQYTVVEAAALKYTGSLTTIGEFNPVQWGLLIYSALCIALVVLMILDCIRRTLNAKVLCILLILLGHLKISAVSAEGLSASFRIGGFLPFSKLLLYGNGAWELTLFLPVGAVVYFLLRKWLTAHYEKPLPPAPPTDEPLPYDPLDKPRGED